MQEEFFPLNLVLKYMRLS